MTRAENSAKGGRVTAAQSPRKAAALRKLHASLRGRRHNKLGISEREYRGLLVDVTTALRAPEPGVRSIRTLADHMRVSDRTVRRWLDGTDWPTADRVRALRLWTTKIQ